MLVAHLDSQVAKGGIELQALSQTWLGHTAPALLILSSWASRYTYPMNKATVLKIVLLIVATRLGYLFVRQFCCSPWSTDIDRYAEYAQALFSGTWLASNIRQYIFPGFPILIGVLHNLIPNWHFSALALVFLGNFVGYLAIASLFSPATAILSTVFPPILFRATSQIYSEGPTLAFLFGSLYLWQRGRANLAIFLSSLAILIRPISLTLPVSFLLYELINRRYRKFLLGSVVAAVPVILLLVFNQVFWGNWLQNLVPYRVGDSALIPFYTILDDYLRLFRDHGYRTLVSGSFYLGFATLGTILLFLKRDKSPLHQVSFLWAVSQYIFLLTIGPKPIMENYGRYAFLLYPLTTWLLIGEPKIKVPKTVLLAFFVFGILLDPY